MTKLTEHTVLARTRAQDLRSVRKLNAWGSELTDVSIVKKLPNVEVLSLSVNAISTLKDFSHCNNLQELYIRKNNICDLSEIRHLRDLAHLKNLWLADNPCADYEDYRLTVIRALPQLQKLDNMPVRPDEVESAMKHGSPLEVFIQKEEDDSNFVSQQPPMTHSVSYEEASDAQVESFNVENAAFSPAASSPTNSMESVQVVRTAVRHSESQNQHLNQVPYHEKSPHEPQYVEREERFEQSQTSPVMHYNGNAHYHDNFERDYIPDHSESAPGTPSGSSSREHMSPRYGFPAAGGGGRIQSRCEKPNTIRMLPKGGKSRSANILSAVLCLIKELDWASLEVVDTAIHCQMEELEEQNSS